MLSPEIVYATVENILSTDFEIAAHVGAISVKNGDGKHVVEHVGEGARAAQICDDVLWCGASHRGRREEDAGCEIVDDGADEKL